MHVAADRAGCLRHDGDTSSLRHGGSQLPAPLGHMRSAAGAVLGGAVAGLVLRRV